MTWTSDSSYGGRARKYKGKKAKKSGKKKYTSDSDSDSRSESESKEDIIKIQVKLKRGDDLVTVLLALWIATPAAEGDVKGKGKML